MTLRFEARVARPVRRPRTVQLPSRRRGLPPLMDEARTAIATSRAALIAHQLLSGEWRSAAVIDAGLTARLVLLDLRIDNRDAIRTERLCRAIRSVQTDSGGWQAGGAGPVDLSTSVLAYFALKSAGASPADADLQRARAAIAELGGLRAIDLDAQRWLALFRQRTLPGVSAVITLNPRHGVAELLDNRETLPTSIERPTGAVASELWEAAIENRAADVAEMLVQDDEAETLGVQAAGDPIRETAAALGGLLATGADPEDGAIVAGRAALCGLEFGGNVTLIAAALRALSEQESARDMPPWLRIVDREIDASVQSNSDHRGELLKALIAAQRCDGSWRTVEGNHLMATALAVQALGTCSEQGSAQLAAESGRRFLANHQQPSGDWESPHGMGVCTTSAALLALAGDAAGHSSEIDAAANWLLAEQKPAGDWGSLIATAAAVEALSSLASSAEDIASSVTWMIDMTADVGGWKGLDGRFCPHTTGIVLRALAAWRHAAAQQLAQEPRPTLQLVRA